jgi:hypothetical protein
MIKYYGYIRISVKKLPIGVRHFNVCLYYDVSQGVGHDTISFSVFRKDLQGMD